MSLGAILGQMMQGGSRGGSPLNDLLRNLGGGAGGTPGGSGTAGGGFGDILGQLQGALGGALGGTPGQGAPDQGGYGQGGYGQGGLGGVTQHAKDFFGKEQVGGLTTGQLGGIGAIAGALLGGGASGAAKGGAMAILGTLAISALRAAQARSGDAEAASAPPASEEIAAVTGPDAERLVLLAMISAAKADGNVDEEEMKKIIGKAGENEVTAEEKEFILSELTTPVDIEALAAQVTSPTQAAAVYAASVLAIKADTDAEKAYLSQLATALKLDPAAVAALDRTAGR